jgi:hypothetical protein
VQRAEAAALGSSCETSAGASAAASTARGDRIQAQTSEQKRRRGAPLGNRRAWRHGRRSAAAIEKRKAGAASRKAAGLVLVKLGLLGPYRHRPRPLRHDQLPRLDAEGLALLRRLKVL